MENKIYAKVFGNFEFVSKEHLDVFLHTMDSNIATNTLIQAVRCAYERGAFTIGEIEIISKTIRTLSENSHSKE